MHLALGSDPRGRLALIGDADLEAGLGEQPAHHRGTDRPGAAGDEYSLHSVVSGFGHEPEASGSRSIRSRSDDNSH